MVWNRCKGEITLTALLNDKKPSWRAAFPAWACGIPALRAVFPACRSSKTLTLAQVKVLKRDKAAARDKGLKLLERVGCLLFVPASSPAQLSGG